MRQVIVMAGTTDLEKAKCDWEGCEKKHYAGEIDDYDEREDGELERDDYVGEWYEPFTILLDSYTEHGIKEGKNIRLKSGRYFKRIKTSTSDHYSTANHHVIPTDVMADSEFDILRHNLKLLGWNINNGLLNGICLPYFEADYIWHNLQPHRSNHPKAYIEKVKESLRDLNNLCQNFCSLSEDKMSDKDQRTLLTLINEKVTDIRDGILNWDNTVHTKDYLNKMKDKIAEGKSRKGYYTIDGRSKAPFNAANKLSEPSGRKYFELIIV